MKKRSHSSQQKQDKKTGEVRIIAGQWRGRKLPVLSSQGLRPTGDRVKETLFNWLAPYIVDANCLDCFAGSGSLGFEALSRYAKAVTFIELDRKVAQQIKQNLAKLNGQQNSAVINQNSLQFLTQNSDHSRFDIVFIDPPFHFGLAQETIDLLDLNHFLADDALIYVEVEKGKQVNTPENWNLLKEKNTQQVSYRLYQFLAPAI